MTLDTIRDIWLVPGHDHRQAQRHALRRTRLRRLPLGEKGLGRFAAHKLGDQIEVVTRAAESLECVVSIDWDVLIREPFLADAEVTIQTRDAQVFTGTSTGTRITISRLRETMWSRGDIRRLFRQITSISSPFTDRSDRFETVLNVPEHPDWVAGVPDADALLQRAPWWFEFTFNKGLLTWSYEFRGVTGIKLAPRAANKLNAPLQIAPDRDLDLYGTEQTRKSSRPKRITATEDQSHGIGPVILTIRERNHSWAGRPPTTSAHDTRQDAEAALLAYVRQNWEAEVGLAPPDDSCNMIEEYFEEVFESYDISEQRLPAQQAQS